MTATRLLQAAPILFLAGHAHAQTSACDQLKGVLAARIEATGVRGYSLEVVPAGTPVPRDARAIGTCESGAYKVLYRRWGGSPSGAASAAAAPASEARAAVAPRQPARRPNEAASAAVAAGSASQVDAAAVVDRPVEQAQPPKAVVAESPPTPQAAGFIAEYWRWIAALLLLPVAGGLWAWVAHRSAYDKAGLPRGPRL